MTKYLKKIKKTRKNISKFIKYTVLQRKKRKVKEWLSEKSDVLKQTRQNFDASASLDVSKRNGIYVFHDIGNSLVKRGTTYEPEVQQALAFLLFIDKTRGNKTVMADIGANIGLHSFFLKSLYPKLDIIAFEPSPTCGEYLKLSIGFNKIKKMRLEKIALSNTTGQLDFYNWGEEGSSDSLKDTNRTPESKCNIIKVSAKRLDDIQNIPDITVIKMDCEGAEIDILKGAKNHIKKNKPVILAEFHPINKAAFGVTDNDIFTLLNEINYSLYTLYFEPIDLDKFKELQLLSVENYILLPNEVLYK